MSLTLDTADVRFLAARLRRLFAHFDIPVPGSDDDARLIGNAGAAIGLLLACPRATREFPYVGRPNFDGLGCSATGTGGVVGTFQQRVEPWLMACFGEAISNDTTERNHRFLEEALELVQVGGCTASEAHQLVDYVFGRPVGEKHQEAGGVMVTLAALCRAQGIDMHEAGEVELARIWTMVEKIRAKQAAKPKHSPLPEHVGGVLAPTARPNDEDALTTLRRNRFFDPKIGQRCIFDAHGGWPYERESAKKKLTLEAEYVVTAVEVRSAHTRIWLDGYGHGPHDWFNNMLFRPATSGVKGGGDAQG